MNWDDWEMIWRRQEPPVGATADIATIKQTFEAKRRKFARGLMLRDYAEAGAGVLVSIVFAYIGWHLKKYGWWLAIATGVILGVTAFFLRERRRVHRSRLGASATLLAKLDAEIAELRHQRRLLANLWPWYLGPIVLAWAIAGAAMLAEMQTDPVGRAVLRHPIFLGLAGGYVALCFGLFWWAWKANRRGAAKRIDPRIEELEKLRRELLTPP
jgi:hypothetical protein